MGRSKKTKTTQGALQKGSPSNWMDQVSIELDRYLAYAEWISTPTHEGLGKYRGSRQQEDERDRE